MSRESEKKKKLRNQNDERLLICSAFRLHQLHSQSEQPSSLVSHHLQVLFFRWTRQRVPPEEVHPLAPVKVQHLLRENLDRLRALEFLHLPQRQKVHIVGRVDGLRCSKDIVRHRNPPAQRR